MDLCNQTELYERLNLLLKEREESYSQREAAIKKHQEALKDLEERLLLTKQEQDQREAGLSALKGQLELERGNLKQFKQEISRDLEELMQKKVELQSLDNARLELEGEREAFLMEKKRAEMGLLQDAETQAENERLKKQNADLSSQVNALKKEKSSLLKKLGEALQSGPDAPRKEGEEPARLLAPKETQEPPPLKERETKEPPPQKDEPKEGDLIRRLGLLAKERIPNLTVLASEGDEFRAAVEDKELQFIRSDPPMARILVKREDNRELRAGIRQLNRIQKEWEFAYTEGFLVSAMPFLKEMEPETVLKKCQDALTRYFK